MIVITGATGQLGRLVIDSLLKKVPAADLVAAVRSGWKKPRTSPALGIQVRQADYNQPASWNAALQGADKVLLISSSEIGQRTQQHRVVIDAAKRAGVKLLAYTSVLHADTSARTRRRAQGNRGCHPRFRPAFRPPAQRLVHRELRDGNSHCTVAGRGLWLRRRRAHFFRCPVQITLTTPPSCTDQRRSGRQGLRTRRRHLVHLSEFSAEISRQSGKTINYVNPTRSGIQACSTGLHQIPCQTLVTPIQVCPRVRCSMMASN